MASKIYFLGITILVKTRSIGVAFPIVQRHILMRSSLTSYPPQCARKHFRTSRLPSNREILIPLYVLMLWSLSKIHHLAGEKMIMKDLAKLAIFQSALE